MIREVVRVSRGGSPGFSPAALRRVLTREGMSIEDLADEIGVSRQAVSAWLQGVTTPAPRSLVLAAKTLGVSPGDLTPNASARVYVADLRVRAGYTQTELAAQLSVTASKLSDIERGRLPIDEALAARIADILSVGESEVVQAWDHGLNDRQTLRRERAAARRRGK